jgi:hypothetical protein
MHARHQKQFLESRIFSSCLSLLKVCSSSGLVKISANWSLVLMYAISISPFLSGTIIRGTPKTPNLSWWPPSAQSCKGLMGAIKSRLGPLKGHDLASPEPSLGQGQPTPEDSRLARGPPQATDTPSARPRPSLRQEATLARSPRQPTVSQEHLMQGWPDTLS